MTIAELIDKRDNVELVRDQIAAILVTESAAQVVLATAAAEEDDDIDPDLWRLRVFTERVTPWEVFRDDPNHVAGTNDVAPVVNVWFENDQFDRSASDTVERQRTKARINVDVLGWAKATATEIGHQTSDVLAAAECERAARLVRNILMAGEYTYLGMQGTVCERWLASRTTMQIPVDATPNAERLKAQRLGFDVTFNEFSPQVASVPLAAITTRVKRTEQGELYLIETEQFPEE